MYFINMIQNIATCPFTYITLVEAVRFLYHPIFLHTLSFPHWSIFLAEQERQYVSVDNSQEFEKMFTVFICPLDFFTPQRSAPVSPYRVYTVVVRRTFYLYRYCTCTGMSTEAGCCNERSPYWNSMDSLLIFY